VTLDGNEAVASVAHRVKIQVAHVAMGANYAKTVKAVLEAEAYDGPSLITAYSHCIAHGSKPCGLSRPLRRTFTRAERAMSN